MSDTEEKKHPASRQKLRKKRKEGSIANSSDVAGFASTAIALLFLIMAAPEIWDRLASSFDVIPDVFEMGAAEAFNVSMKAISRVTLLALFPVLIVAILVSVIVSLIANGGVLSSLKPITPDFKRISIKDGVKRVFGKRGWSEFALALIRLLIWIAFVAFTIWLAFPTLMRSALCSLECQGNIVAPVFKFLLAGAIVLMIITAFVTWRVQGKLFMNEQKMTQTEVKKESKDQHGSTELRRERDRLKSKAAHQPPRLSVEHTDFLFVFRDKAVAISFMPPAKKLPVIIAKARNYDETRKLMKKINRSSVWISENELLTLAGLKPELGEYLPQYSLPEMSKEYWEYKKKSGNMDSPY